MIIFAHDLLGFEPSDISIFIQENKINNTYIYTMEIKIQINENDVLSQFIGRLDTAASQQAATDMEPLMANADKAIEIDCSQLEFISSSGLRLFLSLRKQTIAKGGKVILSGMTPEVKQVFSITGFFSLFEFK